MTTPTSGTARASAAVEQVSRWRLLPLEPLGPEGGLRRDAPGLAGTMYWMAYAVSLGQTILTETKAPTWDALGALLSQREHLSARHKEVISLQTKPKPAPRSRKPKPADQPLLELDAAADAENSTAPVASIDPDLLADARGYESLLTLGGLELSTSPEPQAQLLCDPRMLAPVRLLAATERRITTGIAICPACLRWFTTGPGAISKCTLTLGCTEKPVRIPPAKIERFKVPFGS